MSRQAFIRSTNTKHLLNQVLSFPVEKQISKPTSTHPSTCFTPETMHIGVLELHDIPFSWFGCIPSPIPNLLHNLKPSSPALASLFSSAALASYFKIQWEEEVSGWKLPSTFSTKFTSLSESRLVISCGFPWFCPLKHHCNPLLTLVPLINFSAEIQWSECLYSFKLHMFKS